MARTDIPERLQNRKMTTNRTHQQMEDLRVAQVNGETEKIKANRAGQINDEHFRKEYANYKIDDHDAGNYHVAMEARLFNHQTGAKISKSRIQVFEPAVFNQLVANNGFHGHTTFVLHDPTLKAAQTGERKLPNAPGYDPKTGKVLTTEAGKAEKTGTPVGGQGDPNAGRPGIDLDPDSPNPNKLRDGSGSNYDPNAPLDLDQDGFLGTKKDDAETDDADADVNNEDESLENTNNETMDSVGTIDPNTVNAENLSDTVAKQLYMDLSGKSPDGRWSREKLNEKIAELQGNVK